MPPLRRGRIEGLLEICSGLRQSQQTARLLLQQREQALVFCHASEPPKPLPAPWQPAKASVHAEFSIWQGFTYLKHGYQRRVEYNSSAECTESVHCLAIVATELERAIDSGE